MSGGLADRPVPQVGLVGLGRWGRNWGRVLREAGMLAWGADTDAAAREMFRRQEGGVEVYDAMPYWETGVGADGVVVATPPDTHADVACNVMARGIPVLVEKPMAASIAEAREMVRVSANHDVPLVVGHTYLYSRAVRIMSEWVGEVAPIRYVRMDWLQEGTNSGPDVGPVWNLGPHPVSILLEIVSGPIEGVDMVSVFDGAGRLAMANVRLSSPADGRGEVVSDVTVSHAHGEKVREITVVGDGGTVLCRPNQGEVHKYPKDGPAETRMATRPEPLAALAAEFGRVCSAGAGHHDGTDGLHVVMALEQIEAAAQEAT